MDIALDYKGSRSHQAVDTLTNGDCKAKFSLDMNDVTD